MGVSGLFHTDELPAYGITEEEVESVRTFLDLQEKDAFILVADEDEKARNALLEVIRRAKTAIMGVPEETRKARDDANTEYLRPLPTASRMYVETDIPLQIIGRDYLEEIKSNLPELPDEKEARIIKEYSLSQDLAHQLVRRNRADDFEEVMASTDVDSTTVASTFAYTLKELKRDGKDISKLNTDCLKNTFNLVSGGKITKEAVQEVLVGVCDGESSPEEAAKNLNLLMLSEDDVEKIIAEIVSSNAKLVEERGMGAMGPLMGMAMKELKGKADGKLVNKLLRDKLQS